MHRRYGCCSGETAPPQSWLTPEASQPTHHLVRDRSQGWDSGPIRSGGYEPTPWTGSLSQPTCALVSLQGLADVKGDLVAENVKTRPRPFVGYGLRRDDCVSFRVFALVKTLDAWVITDGKMGRLHKSPREILVTIFGISSPFPFAMTQFLTSHTSTIGCKVADRGKASDVPRFEHDGEREDLPNAADGE